MHVLVIEFDRARQGGTCREKRYWTFADSREAELETGRFSRLAQTGSTHFLRNGDRLTFQECRLYVVATNELGAALHQVQTGEGQLLRHAINPAINDPGYWEDVLTKLEQGQPLD